MAWTSPRTWVAGETVTAAIMNSAVRDNLLHVGGTVGFTRTPSATVGIEPSMGYFVGSTYSSGKMYKGSGAPTTAGTVFSFPSAFADAPAIAVSITSTSPHETHTIEVYGITTTGFAWISATTSLSGSWIAFGA